MKPRRKKKPGSVEASGDEPTVEASGDGPVSEQKRSAADRFLGRPGTIDTGRGDGPPEIPVAWGNVIHDSLRIDDPAKTASRLRDELTLGEGRTEYGIVLKALDRSARNLDTAGRLYRAAKLAEDKYEVESAERLEVLRTAALNELMSEYKAKERPSPTIRDIDDRMLQSWPDEYKAITQRRAELHGLTRSLETLQTAWSSRCADLRIMADKARPIY